MTYRPLPLPERPDLEQLKRQAKDLLRAARDHAPGARSRFRVLPAFAKATDEELERSELALHDAQSVVAREHGFPSWNQLRERVEELSFDLATAADGIVKAATDGRVDRAERLLATFPGARRASFWVELVLGEAAAVETRLAADQGLATRRGGPRDWEPLHYVCHTSMAGSDVADADGLVRVARSFIALGADPNLKFPWLHHGVYRPVLWGATRVVRLLPLAEALLELGADPNDGVTLPLAASAGDLATLDLLRAYGVDPNYPWGTDSSAPLYAMLTWSEISTGARWLVEHGANADPVFPSNGETPLHVVAAKWDVELAELLVEHGADISRPRNDGRTPYAVAELHANRAVADWLLAHGADGALAEVDRLVAAASRGDRATVDALLAGRPALRDAIDDEHYAALHLAAERGDVLALEALLACGFDPDRPDDSIGKTALHSAAMAGQPAAVRVLLAHGASVSLRDREFHGQPLVWAAEGASSHGGGRTLEYETVGRLLIEAGSPLDWHAGDEPAEGLVDTLQAWTRGGP